MAGNSNILGLDVGDSRVGVALAGTLARLPSPLAILDNDATIFENLKALVKENEASLIVVGLPRNMQGEETSQSESSRRFASRLGSHVDVPVVFADESLSTKRAETARYKSKSAGSKHLDDVAACFILEEYFEGQK